MSTVAAHDAPAKPRALARRQDIARFNQKKPGWRDKVRAEELAVTTDDIRALAAALADKGPATGVCVFGGDDALAASSLDLDVTPLC